MFNSYLIKRDVCIQAETVLSIEGAIQREKRLTCFAQGGKRWQALRSVGIRPLRLCRRQSRGGLNAGGRYEWRYAFLRKHAFFKFY